MASSALVAALVFAEPLIAIFNTLISVLFYHSRTRVFQSTYVTSTPTLPARQPLPA